MPQCNTRSTTFKSIINQHFFTKGVKDHMAGLGWDPDYDKWPHMQGRKYASAQWSYERGRHFAAATQCKIPTKLGHTVNPAAVWAMHKLYQEKAVI
jgi:hypothetical protein